MKVIIQTIGVILLMLYYWIKGIVLFFVPRHLRFKDVSGDIVLITGGGSGLGRALAIRFAQRRANVVIWDINKPGIDETIRLVKKEGGKAVGYEVDITDRHAVYNTAEKVKKDVGIVTILVNNAGVVTGKKLLDTPDEKILQTFHVNVLSHFWTVKAFIPDMIAKNHGHVVSIASVAGFTGAVQLIDYCASKHAVIGFEESLRLELKAEGADGINSTVICPYFVNTGMFAGFKSSVLAPLEPDYVADIIMSGVLTNQPLVAIPRLFYTLHWMKTFLPHETNLVLYKALGGYEAMTEFVGRHPEDNNKKTSLRVNNNYNNTKDKIK